MLIDVQSVKWREILPFADVPRGECPLSLRLIVPEHVLEDEIGGSVLHTGPDISRLIEILAFS